MNPIPGIKPSTPYTVQEQELAAKTGQTPRKIRHILRDPTPLPKFLGISADEQEAYYATRY